MGVGVGVGYVIHGVFDVPRSMRCSVGEEGRMIQYQRVYIYFKEFAPYSYCTLISVLTQGMQHYSSDAWIMGHRERGQRSDSHPADTPYNT